MHINRPSARISARFLIYKWLELHFSLSIVSKGLTIYLLNSVNLYSRTVMSQIVKPTKLIVLDILLMILIASNSIFIFYLGTVILFTHSIRQCTFVTSQPLPIPPHWWNSASVIFFILEISGHDNRIHNIGSIQNYTRFQWLTTSHSFQYVCHVDPLQNAWSFFSDVLAMFLVCQCCSVVVSSDYSQEVQTDCSMMKSRWTLAVTRFGPVLGIARN
jgi:hypothetical protein